MSDVAKALDTEETPDSPGEQNMAQEDFRTVMSELDQPASVSSSISDLTSPTDPSLADGGDFIWDIPVDIQVVVGRAEISVADLMKLESGEVLGLDRRLEEPVDIVVNGRLVGKGEITVLDDKSRRFGIKVLHLAGQ